MSDDKRIFEEVKSIQLFQMSANVLPNTSLQEFEQACEYAAEIQRAVLWWIGDLAIAAEKQHPKTHFQAWPEWVSPDLIARCKGVSAAWPEPDRIKDATWTQHMQNAKRPDRVQAVETIVDSGMTSDESRRNPPPPVEPEKNEPSEQKQPASPPRWLLAVDVNYFIHTYFHSGNGVETAAMVVRWLIRLIQRLQETKGLTDAVCCTDASTNHRRALTASWDHKYKPRIEKDPELVNQLNLAVRLLEESNLPVVSVVDMEADDVMASYAHQFPGKVTLLTGDKDMRQCLGPKCNILRDVKWEENPQTNVLMPVYDWISAKSHLEDGMNYNSTHIVGITPEQWPHFQAIAGDSVDGIKGCPGIGAKGAMKLILEHGTVQAVIAACKDNNADLSQIKRLAVLDFESVADTMLKLTTMRRDLDVPMVTAISMRRKE